MKTFAIALFVATTTFIAAPRAHAADQQIVNDDPCQGTMDIDICMWSDSDPASGGNYISCQALGTQNQGCQSVTKDQIFGTVSCATVYYSAKCNCDPKTKSATGNCTYVAR
ncbi:MAG TPA: hypothetical protein VGJ81_02725 [Thermoanaerobaculia bacterium]|jgi:hypothetical protein